MQDTIAMLKAKAAQCEAAAAREIAAGERNGYDGTEYAEEYLTLASMFQEAIGKADTMSEREFAQYAASAVAAMYQLLG